MTPTLTPGTQALSVAQKSVTAPTPSTPTAGSSGHTVNNQNGTVFADATTGPYTKANAEANGYTPPATNNPSTLGEFVQVATMQGNGLKEAQKMYQDSLLAGTSSINGNNQFYRDPKGTLKTGVAPGAIDVTNKLNQYFNSKQIASFENRNLPVDTSNPYSAFGDVLDNKQFSSADQYKKLREDYGVSDLEAQINELSAQESEQIALTRKRLDTASNSPVSLGVISGRQGEIERQDSTRLGDIQRTKNNLVNQLNTKNSSIKMFMDFYKEDYSMAKDRFDTAFSQNMQMQNLLRGQKQDANSEKDKEQDNYRAMYNTIFNGISSGSVDPSQFTPEMKAQFASLEMKAGLPSGFTDMVRNKNPKADIIQQSIVEDSNGKQVLNLVMRDQVTGKMSTQNIVMGNSTPKNGRYQYKDDGTVFDTTTGAVLDNSSMETADFRSLAYKYPNEASLKNNNPAGITFNTTFADTLTKNGIKFENGTERPTNEGGSYFSFPNVAEGMKAYNLLWSMPSYQNMTVGKAMDRWGTGSLDVGVDKTKKISQLTPTEIQTLQVAQLKKESPGFYKELQNIGGSKDTKTSKESEKINTGLRDDASKLIGKMDSDGMGFDIAHAQLYSKYGGPLKGMGYTDEEVKQALHKLLGGK